MIYVSPSILSSDLMNLESEIIRLENSNADYVHVDVLDGVFANNIAFGPSFVSSLKRVSKIPLDVHLMIINPLKYIDSFINAGSDIITIHVETIDSEMFNIIEKKVHQNNRKLGITLKPSTDIKRIEPYLNKVDLVLIMSVNPGFSGQKFMPEMLNYVRYVVKYKKENNLDYIVEIDGGINESNIDECIKNGVNMIVSGNYLFSSNMKSKIEKIKSLEL